MKIQPSVIPEIVIIEPKVIGDDRGFFVESWHADRYAEHGFVEPIVQENHSRSKKGVLRGLHYQLKHPQGKLLRVVKGVIFDVAVDIRQGSPTFARWVGIELSEENHREIYIPPGFAHGYCVLSNSADVLYKCTDYYQPDDQYGLIWNDPEIGINWPTRKFTLSDKDARNPTLGLLRGSLPKYEEQL